MELGAKELKKKKGRHKNPQGQERMFTMSNVLNVWRKITGDETGKGTQGQTTRS